MKFARYLQDTQTPEWTKAYIDYRGLKKTITAIRRAQDELASGVSAGDNNASPGQPRQSDVHSDVVESQNDGSVTPATVPHGILPAPNADTEISALSTEEQRVTTTPLNDGTVIQKPTAKHSRANTTQPSNPRRPSVQDASKRPRRGRGRSFSILSRRSGTTPRRLANPLIALPLSELYGQLSPQELQFFTSLDAQLDKIDSFYVTREEEMNKRTKILQEQLKELRDHKILVHEVHHPRGLPSFVTSHLKFRPKKEISVIPEDPEAREEGDDRSSQKAVMTPRHEKDRSELRRPESARKGVTISTDLDDYLYAKKKLKKAIREHYRGLEVLQNYRILNITGFRKALKKFEKVTKIRAQQQYMSEKIERSALASDKSIRVMIEEMEELYATSFMRGNKKRARDRLRGGTRVTTHHYSTFRTGLFLGVAIPALISGIVQSFQPHVRQEIRGWDILIYIYGIFLIPVLFSILIATNLMVWAHFHINYVFIFELDTRTRLDHREYLELPCLLFSGLCYAFWLSFSRIGSPHVSPSLWLLVWLGFAGVLILNPLPLWFKHSRFWFLRLFGKLFVSGTRRVEFADFWLGDQLCSLIFPLANLSIFACAYASNFDDDWVRCSASSHIWPIAFVLSALPLVIRLVQSIKRYADSGLQTHLINGGKYGSGVVSYLFYYLWRHTGTMHGPMLALWCLFNTAYALYATGWDFYMDWSLLRLNAPFPLLREELVYSNYVPLYYFAMITNVIIRFIWVIYIPTGGLDLRIRFFITAVLEMFRRWQWNFLRLENEHLGNVDQYRVTREVPLPYAFDGHPIDEDNDDDDDDGEESLPRNKSQ